jgi:hypothetical protein
MAGAHVGRDPFFFGYGSLVNRGTHDFPQVARARVRGWARTWKRTKLRQVAFLTAVEAPGQEIEGLIAAVPGADWAALDAREYAYDRHAVIEIDHDHGPEPRLDVHIYRTKPEHDTDGSEEHPILLSYLDTVIQGYLTEFGEAGARGSSTPPGVGGARFRRPGRAGLFPRHAADQRRADLRR